MCCAYAYLLAFLFASDSERWLEQRNSAMQAAAVGNNSLARQHWQAALKTTDSFEAGDMRIAATLVGLVSAERALGLYLDAFKHVQQSFNILVHGPAVQQFAAWRNLCLVQFDIGQYAEAEKSCRKALPIPGANDLETAELLNQLANTLAAQRKLQESVDLNVRVLKIRLARLSPADPAIAETYSNLGALALLQDRKQEAYELLSSAVHIVDKPAQPCGRGCASIIANLATVCRDIGKYQESQRWYQRAIAAFEAAATPDHPNLVSIYLEYAELARRMHNKALGKDLKLRVKSMEEANAAQRRTGMMVFSASPAN